MKTIVLFGGSLGFFCAALTGVITGHSPDRVLLDSAVGAFAGGLLFRWFWQTVIKAYAATAADRNRAAEEIIQQAHAAASQPVPATAPARK